MKSRFTIHYFLLFISLAGYVVLGYFTQRENYIQLFALFAVLFASYFFIISQKTSLFPFKVLIGSAILFRLVLMFCYPALSDDFYRFIWDGQLLSHGINPYTALPPELYPEQTSGIPLADFLFSHLNNLQKSNYTCYPPFNEMFFYLAALISPNSIFGNVLVMRLFILLAETGTIFVGIKILKHINKPVENILLYALNPLVIIELTANLHFEAIMIFFLFQAFYFVLNLQNKLSAAMLALSVSVKLVPLMLIPVFYRKLGFWKWMVFALISTGIAMLLFSPVPLWSAHLGFLKSINLYFQHFEFNASLYYMARQIGLWIKGYNMIATIGPLMMVLTFIIIILLAFRQKNNKHTHLFISVLFIFTTYYFFATTVHPWYITTLVAVSVFTHYRFPIIWSLAIILSYFTYSNPAFAENLWLVFVEYLMVYGVLVFEVIRFGRQNKIEPDFIKQEIL